MFGGFGLPPPPPPPPLPPLPTPPPPPPAPPRPSWLARLILELKPESGLVTWY